MVDAGNGWLHAARTERDAKLLLRDHKYRRGAPLSRRARMVTVAIVGIALLAWGVSAFLVG